MAEKVKSKSKEKKSKEQPVVTEQIAGEEKHYVIRGNILFGKVISAKANKTVTVERELTTYLPKYERYKKSESKIHAHNPNNMAKEGDLVKVGETRRISKTKSFIVMQVIGKDDK
ncbi:MAG: 30S ribosomal protein S17 [Candidatus ainarchaeum sp.]|jgi:small subunit ribosomal protein S17|nr:30S ribosomal protein S17 [Candidatus ainarchaeum sp.]MDD3085766.1 30S ribosomal protein S17 [Candidatus ainarchaeum sp.]MDD4128499.1 30S ribosomal protein S17 [Candidatus ainarchaeum sp.]MDD4467977.1 30S ribosomal protein S17 [Candidatus ainarchaeum sp.]HPM85554.1 30S ribosomal protein S17 [archaeon]